VIRNQFVKGTSLRAPSDLPIGDYRVWVQAKTVDFVSPWSNPRDFSVGMPPRISSPANNATTGRRPEIIWTGITGTERYEIWITNLSTNTVAINVANITGTKYTPPTQLAVGNYRVWVRAISTMGETTVWSKSVDFKVVSSPVPDSDFGDGPLTQLIAAVLPQTQVAADGNHRQRHQEEPQGWNAQAVAVPIMTEGQSTPNLPPSAEIEAAFDTVMAGWDISEWWNSSGSATAVQATATTSRRSRQQSGDV